MEDPTDAPSPTQCAPLADERPHASETRGAIHLDDETAASGDDVVLFDAANVSRSGGSPQKALGSVSVSPNSSTRESFDDDLVVQEDDFEPATGRTTEELITGAKTAREQEPRASSLMNFDAFVTGELSCLPLDAAQDDDCVGEAESDGGAHSQRSLGTPDDEGDDDDDYFRDAFESDDAQTPTPRRSRVSLNAISSIRSAAVAASAAKLVLVKEKTQQVAQSKKQALSEFQKKGGLVSWLHGEPTSDEDGDEDGDDEEPSEPTGFPVEHENGQPPANVMAVGETLASGNSEAEALRSASLPSDPVTSPQQQATSAAQHRSFPTRHEPQTPSSLAAGFLSKSLGGRQRASSLLENLYGKVKKSTSSPAATPPRSPTRAGAPGNLADSPVSGERIAFQPSPRKEQAISEEPYSFGFEAFTASRDTADPYCVYDSQLVGARDSRQRRTVSADSSLPSSRQAAPSFQKRLSGSLFLQEEPEKSSQEVVRHLPLDECLGDPKLAAEFVSTVMPEDSALLKLLYSIEEYEALVTTEPVAALSVQTTYATTVIDKFLVHQQPSGHRVSVLSKLPASTPSDLKLVIEQLQLADALALPKTLFRDVHEVVYEVLRDGYDAFKLTREYALLLEQHQQQERFTTSTSVNVLTLDAVLASEWCCTVFWMHLYRTAHHHRLSFVMEKAFKLDKLYQDFTTSSTQSTSGGAATQSCYERLVAQLKLVNRKFLQKHAPVALPVVAAPLCRLKEEICIEINHLPPREGEDADGRMAAIERVMGKIDAFALDVQKEFKRLSFERFASFTASALYRDFVTQLQPSSAASETVRGDIVQLLRASRIPFHQAPNESPPALELSSLLYDKEEEGGDDDTSTAVDSDAIFKVFSFVKRDVVNAQKRTQPYEFVNLLDSSEEGRDAQESEGLEQQNALLYQTLEHFLIPEAAPRTFKISDAEAQQSLCFNFVAGNGENAVYGAVWRLPLVQNDGVTTHGMCVLSKYPLVDSLRLYLRSFSLSKSRLDSASGSDSGILSGDLKPALDEAKAAFQCYFLAQHQDCSPQGRTKCDSAQAVPPPPPRMDFSLEDLFDCLSITHILRLVGFVLLEKKIVLVSSSYSVLLSVGEALKALIHPLVWSHIYVPVLPLALKGYLHCPTPFIFGLHNSYVRASELPRPSDDLVVVNLDRDSLTGGGEVFLPPTRSASMRDRLVRICRPRLQTRDQIDYCMNGDGNLDTHRNEAKAFPSEAIRDVFHEELREMLAGLETFAFRFAFNDKFVTVVDASNKSRAWTSDASRFHATLLQTQAFSAHLSSLTNL